MLIYSVSYHDLATGKMHKDFDIDIDISSIRAGRNEVAIARCNNGDRRDVRYITESGEILPPSWAVDDLPADLRPYRAERITALSTRSRYGWPADSRPVARPPVST